MELDALGNDVGLSDPDYEEPTILDQAYPRFGDASNIFGGCTLDGAPMDCNFVIGLLNTGSAERCPNDDCGPRVIRGHDGHPAIVPFGINPDTGQPGYWQTVRVDMTLDEDGVRTTYRGTEIHYWGEAVGTSTDRLFSHPQRRSLQETYPGVMSNVRIVNTGGDSALERHAQDVLGRIMRMVMSGRCNAAFERAGLATPDDLVQKGIILASRRALTDASYNSSLGITEDIRVEANKSNAPLQTIRPQFTSSGKPVIIFAADAFEENFLDEGMPHEFIHGAGVGQVFGFWGRFRHDLRGYQHYDDIIENCQPN